jgi:hypothetical protein
MTVLDTRALNRATLARQLLLDHADVPVLDAIAHLCGLQAQEPQEPFVGLWSRLRAFDPSVLSDLLIRRSVVRTHLMRRRRRPGLASPLRHHAAPTGTRHLPPRARRDRPRRTRGSGPGGDGRRQAPLDDRTHAGACRPLADAGAAGTGRNADCRPIPMAQLPPRGLWRTKAGVRNVLLSSWLGREIDPPAPGDSDPVGKALVRRYLAAFGPAASADLRAWCGLAGLPAAIASIREELVTFRDERGRELLDLPDAPRPDPDTPAPVRFLPAFDSAILGYHDRSRIIDDAHRGLSVAGARVVLVDGRVAATWSVKADTVIVTPLRRFSPADLTTVAEQGRALASFLSDNDSHRVQIAASPPLSDTPARCFP